MSTLIRPEITKKNKYWISKERYYELKHFCLQYPEWKKEYLMITNDISVKTANLSERVDGGTNSNYIEDISEKLFEISSKIDMIDKVCLDAADDLHDYIREAVTLGKSYGYLSTKRNIPCCKDVYYDIYRKFFWMLSDVRD